MFSLIGNENMKIYRRPRTWIMIGILLLAVLLIAIIMYANHPAADPNWKHAVQAQIATWQQTLHGSHMPAAAAEQLKQQIQVYQYDLAHNIDPKQTTGWSFALTAENLSTLLIAFIVVVAGDIVASEFGTGTIKMLLTQPATRSRIMASKYLSSLLYALFLTVVMVVFSIIIGWLFFGFQGAGVPRPYVGADNNLHLMSTAGFWLMQYGFLLVQILVIATIAFMISAIFRSSALAITISLLVYLVGNTLISALSVFGYTWVKYILFANTDLSQFVVGGPHIHGLTLGFSITVVAVYYVVMMALSWLVFIKRDVAYT